MLIVMSTRVRPLEEMRPRFCAAFHKSRGAEGQGPHDISDEFDMFHSIAIFALASAVFYCVSMIAMKSFAATPHLWLVPVMGIALALAVTFEIFALRQERLGLIYIGILGAEVLIIGLVSLFQFDESYSTREVVGIGIVLIGTAIAWT